MVRFLSAALCVAVFIVAGACASAPKPAASSSTPAVPASASASASSFNRANFEKALAGRSLDVLASYSSSEKGSLGAGASSADREKAHSRYEALRQEILLVPASQAALAPNLPELTSLLAKPEARHFTSSERSKLESVLARYASQKSPAEVYRTDKIDPRISRVTASLVTNAARAPETQLATLVSALIVGENDQFTKIKLIHDWIADTVTYDVAMLSKTTVTGQDLATVLTSRRAVCAGYAALFERMAKIAGFEVKTVHGYTKGLGGDFDFNFQNSHAWNMVRIDDLWYFVDTTFDAGAFDATGGRGQYKKRYSTDYLFAPPVQLRYTHYPEDRLDQLSASPMNRLAFKNQALVTPEYFKLDLAVQQISGSAATLSSLTYAQKTSGLFSLDIEAPQNTLVEASLYDGSGREIDQSTFASRTGPDTWRILIAAPSAGKNVVRVFAGPKDAAASASATLSSVLQFELQRAGTVSVAGASTAGGPSKGTPVFPKIYARYHDTPGELLESPLSGVLAKGSAVHFAYRSSAKYVAIIYDTTFTLLKPSGDGNFVLDFSVPSTSVVKLGVSDDNIHYGIALSWEVR